MYPNSCYIVTSPVTLFSLNLFKNLFSNVTNALHPPKMHRTDQMGSPPPRVTSPIHEWGVTHAQEGPWGDLTRGRRVSPVGSLGSALWVTQGVAPLPSWVTPLPATTSIVSCPSSTSSPLPFSVISRPSELLEYDGPYICNINVLSECLNWYFNLYLGSTKCPRISKKI